MQHMFGYFCMELFLGFAAIMMNSALFGFEGNRKKQVQLALIYISKMPISANSKLQKQTKELEVYIISDMMPL